MSKKYIAIIITAMAVIGGAAYFYIAKTKKAGFETVSAERGILTQEVSVTGRVKPAQSVDLAFEKSGRAVWTGAKVGDNVYAGQAIVQLFNADLAAQLGQAEADLKYQQSKLEELLRGATEENIAVQRIKTQNAEIAIEEKKKNLLDKIQDAYTKADDAIRNKTDQLYSEPRSSDPKIIFPVIDSQIKTQLGYERFLMENFLLEWKAESGAATANSDLVSLSSSSKQKLNSVKSLLEKINLALNILTSSTTLSQTTIDGWRADLSTARANINTAVANLTSAEESLRTAESNLSLEQSQLELKLAGPSKEQVDAQRALIDQAQAGIDNINAQLAKTYLRSPINGVVTKQDAKTGEIVSAGAILVSIISESQFEMEAFVPEADIAKVKLGDAAKVTLDAYGSDVEFPANVAKIDPGETVLEGVATYKTTLHFTDSDSRIKSGMTANIDILTAKKEGALIIPQRAVIAKENGGKTVKILDSEGAAREVSVKTGLRGSDGNIEIIEGLKEGDQIIISEK